MNGTSGAASIRLPSDPRSVGMARVFVANNVTQLFDSSDVLLMTSEVVDNAVRHVAGDVTVTVRGGPPVRVEVHDQCAATDDFRQRVNRSAAMPEGSSESGRGLAIVRTLSTRMGVDDGAPAGKTVWFEYD